jgi:hypothetical protein
MVKRVPQVGLAEILMRNKEVWITIVIVVRPSGIRGRRLDPPSLPPAMAANSVRLTNTIFSTTTILDLLASIRGE